MGGNYGRAKGRIGGLVVALLPLACAGDDSSASGSDPTTGPVTTGGEPSTTEGNPDPTMATTNGDTEPGPLDSSGTAGATETGDPTTGEVPKNCGDGNPDPDEDCDDGNGIDADGCNNDCTISGSIEWFHSQAGGVGQDEQAWAVRVDPAGNAYVAGEIFGADVNMWVRQYTTDDAVGWTQVLDGGGGNDGARAGALSGGTFYVAGYRVIPGQSNNIWIRSFDLDGNVGLNVEYNDPANGSDVSGGVAVAPGGNFVVAGNEAVALQGADIWVRKYDPAGTEVWTRGANGPANSTDHGRDVAVDAAGNVAVVGYHTVTGEGRNIWVRLYDTNGTELWTQTSGNPSLLDDEAHGVAFDPDGNIVVAGFELDPVLPFRLWLRKYDPAGNILWTEQWDGETGEGARAFDVTVDDAGDIIVTGQNRTGAFYDFIVRKYDANGNGRWSTIIPAAAETNQVGRSVAVGPNRRIWVAGGLNQGIDGIDIYVARLAP